VTPGEPRRAFVVSHTHWDREWYLTFPEFRVDLVRVIGAVLDALEADPRRHFLLDGQVAVLEDHLRVRPEDAPRVKALAEAGRLSLGPWFVLPDEFLVSGESLARNLLLGDRIARAHGGRLVVGYMPDSFGHTAQMPQILREAGLDAFVFERGLGDEAESIGWRFAWRGPDGSEVLALNHVEGYCAAGSLGHEELWHAHTRREIDPARAVRRVRELFAAGDERPGADPFLVSNGCDHFPPQRDFRRVLDALAGAFPDTTFVHAGLEDFVAAAREAGPDHRRREGEMLGGFDRNILSGVWSARMHLKRENERCETLLAGVAEPLLAYAAFAHGQDYPAGLLRDAWRELLLNHPHDTICGCSVDQVHRDMMPRFATARATAERLLQRALSDLTPAFGDRPAADRDTVLCLANPSPQPRREVVTRTVVLQPFGYGPLRLVDDEGRGVPCEIVDTRHVERFWGVDHRWSLSGEAQGAAMAPYLEHFPERMSGAPDDGDRDTRLTLRFEAEFPACGHAVYRLEETPPDDPPERAVTAGLDTLDNGLVAVRLHADGRVDLTDRRTGAAYPGLCVIEHQGDAGDTYDFLPAGAPATPGIVEGPVRMEAGALEGTLACDLTLRLPARLAPDRREPVGETVDCAASLRLTLRRGSPVVDMRLDLDNRAEDHRLRLRFPTPLRTDVLVSDDRYLVQSRPLIRETDPEWVQPTPPTWPQRGFSCLEDGSRGLAVFNRGLPEVEGFLDDGGAGLALTLLRCVGWLSRDDMEPVRRGNAGPTLHTPEAQCPGRHAFALALMPYAGGWLEADVAGASARWRRPPLSVQGIAPGAAGSWLLSCDEPRVRVCAVKRCEDRDTLIVRVCNLAGEEVSLPLEFGKDLTGAWRSDLLEARGETLPLAGDRRVETTLRPHEIASLEIAFD